MVGFLFVVFHYLFHSKLYFGMQQHVDKTSTKMEGRNMQSPHPSHTNNFPFSFISIQPKLQMECSIIQIQTFLQLFISGMNHHQLLSQELSFTVSVTNLFRLIMYAFTTIAPRHYSGGKCHKITLKSAILRLAIQPNCCNRKNQSFYDCFMTA